MKHFEKLFRGACLCMALLLMGLTGCGGNEQTQAETETGATTESVTVVDPATEDLSKPQKYQVIYNSDSTHIQQNESPYHAGDKNSILTKKMVTSAVMEAIDAGIDCYSLTPGQCWVPWWPSQYKEAHADWYFKDFGGKNADNPYWNYIHVRGNDMIQDCIDVCRENGVGFFLNFRLNDAHHVTADRTPENSNIAFDSEIVLEHPEYQIGYVPSWGRTEVVLDFQHEAVVENRLKLIRELIELYEIDGFELDFTRRYVLFNVDTTTSEQRLEIMLGMLREVRAMLDEATERDGRYRHLSVRIPVWDTYYDALGIDTEAFAEAGVTVFNLTASYFTAQENLDLTTAKEKIGDALLYYELHFITAVDYDEDGRRIHRRATVEQLCTTALIAYEQGADGISFFNFQYYRGDRVSELDRPYTEPPWEVIGYVGDYAGLKEMGQHYFIGKTWRDSFYNKWKLPTKLTNVAKTFDFYMVSPTEGWTGDAIVTVQSLSAFTDQKLEVTFNSQALESVPWSGKPYENVYTQMIGAAENYRSWKLPASLLREGDNVLSIRLTNGAAISVCFIEITAQP